MSLLGQHLYRHGIFGMVLIIFSAYLLWDVTAWSISYADRHDPSNEVAAVIGVVQLTAIGLVGYLFKWHTNTRED